MHASCELVLGVNFWENGAAAPLKRRRPTAGAPTPASVPLLYACPHLQRRPQSSSADRARTPESPREEGQRIRPLSVAMKAFEREYLLRALAESGGRKTAAADMLGISRKNLWEKLRAHGVDDVQAELDRGSVFEHEAS